MKNNYFIFCTNTDMSEKGKDIIVEKTSMFVNRKRWNETFSNSSF